MKKLIFILPLIWGFSNYALTQVPSNDMNWEAVFIDDFNTLDLGDWEVLNNFDHYGEPQMYTNRTDNVYINNGNLILKIIKENYMGHSYTSGWINTKTKYQYGYFEIRCKLPTGKGFWPAFWLHDGSCSGGNYNEIDIFEMDGSYPTLNSNCVVTCDPMNLVAWTSFVCSNDNLCFLISNASTYTVKIHTVGGTLVHQGSGSASNSPVCVWSPSGVASGIYIATVTFENDCQEISNTYQVFVAPCMMKTDGGGELDEEKNEFEKLLSSAPLDTTVFDFEFKIFPNPNNGSFSVKIINDIMMPYSLEVINSVGEVMYNVEHLNANSVNVRQAGLPKGAYFIRVKSSNRVATQKFIIQ